MLNCVPLARSLLWNLFLLLCLLRGRGHGASFYGDGFVQLKTVESSNKNSLHVRFRTSSPDGLLFLAAGENDFLWVALHSGRIQVRIELGSGERTLRSEKGTPLNDLMWHTLELYHNEHNVTLTVDKNSHGSLRMPAPDLELSVQEGLYVGGLGSLDKLYLFEDMCPVGFRGCMDEVLFNEHNLLSSLRPYSGFKMVHEVSLGCSPQFSASVNDSISFFSSKAYMSLPVWEVPQEGVFECELYTSAEEGLLLYSSAGQGDYVALEIRDRHLVVVVRIGGSKTALRATAAVNEGGWHSVRLYLAPRSLHLTVGEEILNSSFGAKSRPLQLSGPLFLGGVDTSTRAEVRRNGLLSVVGKRIGGGSFKGCLRNIRVNDQNMGLPNAVVTNDVSVGCEPVRHVEPVTTSSPATVQPDTTEQLEVDRKKVQTFLFFQDLEVLEGGRAPLESKHIKVNLEFRKLGIRQSQIMFRIEEQPVHGQLRLDVDPDQEQNTFSMLDLWHGRVMYVHGGSEDPLDFFIFSVFTSSKKEVPGYLKGNRLHRFNITVEPINDAPELSLPEGNLFVLLENSKRRLTTNMLRAMDPDTNSTELILTLLGNLTADAGFLELEDNPGQAVNSFSYLDLELGKVSYVHTGIRNSRMAIRASDGEKVSNTVVLRVMAVTLQHTVVNNTGVEVTQGGATHITNKHLAVQVNLAMQAMDIRFDVIEPPIYGELQRLHSSGEWKQTSTFTQKLLEKERLRYLSTFQASQLSNVTDSIKCKVTIGSLSTDEVVFVIRVRWIHYKVTRSKMEVDSDRAVILTPQEFRVISKGVKLSEDDIHIRLLTLPRKGDLLFNDEVLKKNSTFSQRNITDHKLQYKIFEKALEDMRDMFSFQVYSKYSHSGKHDFRISIKANVHSIVLRNHGLSVLEGESKVITKDMLFSETLSSRDVHYFVTSSPQHGKLARINHANSTTSSDNIVEFTNQDIIEESILYVHDDSETTHDAFMFRASLSPLKDKVTVTEGTFKISIQLVNDEKPVRVIDKVFHVARDSQRLLTLEDLCYHDPDSDYDNGQLLYTRRGIPMGELVWVNDTSHKLYQFHQRDLEEKRVLFVHRGVSFGRFVLFITDGKHYTSTLLEVSAQDPYLKVANNTGLLVQKGKEVILRPANFSITTNVDVRSDEDVLFEIFHPPSYGTLLCDGVEGDAFTLYDVKAGHVAYHHDNSMNMMDAFSFTATVNGLRLDVTVSVKVYLESHQRPPQVIHNNSVLVEEGKPVKIHKKELEVVHEDSTPDEIVYSMKTPASYGFLRRYVEGEDHYQGTLEKPIQSFSQVDINTGHIQYVQVKHGHSNDSFSVDVTNGILTVSDLIVSVEIIPLHIPLEVSNVTLKEGSSKALTQEVIKVTSRHFKGLHFQYHVIEGPHHGHIEHSRIPGVPIPSFTRMQVEHEFIYYVHDGSETTADNFTLVANDTDLHKQSLPHIIHVTVTPVNDEPPVIVVNRILRVWVDSMTEITTEELSAEDHDSPPESVEFIITPPSNGHLALKSAPSRPVLNFTQAHILHGRLVFVHSGALSGGFHFQVNDGVNFAPRQIFSITAKSLVLSLERNRELRVFPGSSNLISVEDLLIVTNDYEDIHGNRTIIYSVTSPPKLGRLVRTQEDNSTEAKQISTFTQNMVKAGIILYEHTEPVGWAATDSFIFTAFSPPASLPPHTFTIYISYDNTGPEHRTVLLANSGAVVAEGSRVTIDKSKLDASNLLGKLPEEERHSYEIWYGVTILPHYGTIVVGERNLTREKPNFSQFILNKYGITYVHDDSETTSDIFHFDVWLNHKGKPTQRPQDTDLMVSESFNITVTPVNDQPPFFKTQAPGLRVVKGDSVALGPENLQVEDLDTLPEDIHYTVISKPKNGFLALEGSLNESTVTFTQADVNAGKVYFVQDGHPTSGIFYFSVTDGFHHPLYKLFNLEVDNVTITVVNNTGLSLVQGQTTVTLTLQHLAAVTNKKNMTIKYHVTSPPSHGRLMIMDEVAICFDQDDLRLGKVSYHMTDLSSSQDSFELALLTAESNLTNQEVNITVKPLIHLGDHVRIADGVPVKLRKDVLDATELASISASDPIFEIIIPPKHGKLVKAAYGLGGPSQAVQSFSFTDIEQGRVAIEEHINFTAIYDNATAVRQNVTANVLNDSFVFLLKATNVQPAKGEFVYVVLPYDPKTGKHIIAETPVQPTRNPSVDRMPDAVSSMNHPSHTHPTTRPHRIPPKTRSRHRWGNHTRSRSTISTAPKSTLGKHDEPPRNPPVRVESLPRPASDPLLIILPFLACLLLIVILVVLTLVFRHRREKRAQPAMIPDIPENSGEDIIPHSPYLGQPERSLTVPSVVVTPLTPRCPVNPVLEAMHSAALVPAMAPPDSPLLLCTWTPVDHASTHQCSPATPTLRQNQYWV
ncbi:chondroitin sulfate proteoglycan 4-like [Pygocentrus nattereri]|uniref:chondroitin sulfate proteoglycan 4-like n=1 Tax=Pygocentrus nattereri TaxID=42514 RepID=UPI0008149618|nr:chondroitin sulfate proteoglycan 4-like [Pygocentrus nattereri]